MTIHQISSIICSTEFSCLQIVAQFLQLNEVISLILADFFKEFEMLVRVARQLSTDFAMDILEKKEEEMVMFLRPRTAAQPLTSKISTYFYTLKLRAK